MSRGWSYKEGDWWVSCDSCQKQIRASEAKHRWDGFIVCSEDFEERHPQDFVRVKPEGNHIPFSRPEPADVFTDVTYYNDYCDANYILDQYGYVYQEEDLEYNLISLTTEGDVSLLTESGNYLGA